jgi:signal transduction histidine kinase
MKTVSIRKRIVYWFLLFQGVLAVSGIVAVLVYARNQQLKAFDAEVHARATALLGNAESREGRLELAQPGLIPADHLYLIRTSRGILAGSNGRPDIPKLSGAGNFLHGGRQYRGGFWRHVPLPEEEAEGEETFADVAYAMPTTDINFRFRNLLITAITLTCCFLLLSALGTWWLTARGLASLEQLAQRAASIETTRWRFEVPAQALGTAELAPLANALIELMQRLKAAFDREQRFLSDAGHELKTAVTIQKSTLQLLQQGELDTTDYKSGIARALKDTERTEKLVQSMLVLASSERATNSPGISALSDSLAVAIHDIETMAQQFRVRIVVNHEQFCQKVVGDADELAVVWRNLLQNALQHSPPESEIQVTINAPEDSTVEICIADSGAGISAKDLPYIFDRFYRADRSRARRTGGFGLGLPIAKALAEKNLGSLKINSVEGKGASASVSLAVPSEKNQ